MCGRFAFFSPREAVLRAFPVNLTTLPEPRYNIAPTQNVLVIHSDSVGSPVTQTCRWGLVPFWAKDPSIGARMINARAETMGEKPSYRQSFRQRRCLILADGFYEWQQTASGKLPYFISASDGRPFGMAGLWDQWTKQPGEPLLSCTIVTVPANDFMQPLHQRMPVLLDWSAGQQWLDAGADAKQLLQLIMGSQPVALRAWGVSKDVNNPRNDSPELIAEIAQ